MFDFLFGHKEGEGSKHDILRDIPLEKKLDILVENSPDAIVVTDLKFAILKASIEAARLCGSKAPKDIIGKNTSGYLAKGELKRFIPIARKFLKTKKIKNAEVKFKTIHDVVYDGLIDAQLIVDSQTKKKYVIAVIRNISHIKKLQEQTSESNQYLKLLFENPNVGFYKYDRSLRFTAVNKTICEFLEKKEKDLIGKNILSIGAISAKQAIIAAGHIRSLLSGRIGAIVERYDFITSDKKIARGIVSSAPLVKDGKVVEVFNIIHDIRREEEEIENVRQSDAIYKTLFDYSQDILIVIDIKGKIVDINKVAERISGYKKEDIIGKRFNLFIDKKDLPRIIKNYVSIFSKSQNKLSDIENIEILSASKKRVPVAMNKKFIPIYKDNKIDKILLFGRDISEEIYQKKKITELENIYKLIAEYSGEGIFAYDTKMRFIELNPFAEKYIGPREKYIGKSILTTNLLPLNEIALATSNARKLLSGKVKSITEKYHIRNLDGSYIPVRMISSPIYQDEKIIGVANIVHDMTNEEKLLDKVSQSEKQYRELFEKSADILIIVDRKGNIINANQKALDASGYKLEEIIGKKISLLVDKKYITQLYKLLALYFIGVSSPSVELKAIKKDKSRLDIKIESGVVPIYKDNTLSAVMVTVKDITEKKIAESAILSSQEKYKSLFENSQDLLVVLDNFGKIIDINKIITSVYGYEKEEIVGKNIIKLLKPSDVSKAVKYIAMDMGGKLSPSTIYHLRDKKGNYVPFEFSPGSVPIKENEKIVAAMYSGRDVSFRQEAEKEISKSHQLLEKIFTSFDSAILVLDEKTPSTIIDANTTAEKIFGFEKKDLIDKSPNILFKSKDDYTTIQKDLLLSVEIGEPFSGYELSMKRSNGQIFDAEHSIIELTDNKKRIGWIHIIRDISSRKQIEKEIQESAKLTNDILNLSPIGIYIANSSGQIEYVNKKMLEISGEKEKDFLRFNIIQTPSYRHFPELQKFIKSAMSNKEHFVYGPVKFTSQISKKTNWRRFIGIPTQKDENNKLVMMVEDVTESVEREQSLVKSKKELQEIIDTKTSELKKTNIELQKQIVSKDIAENELMASKEKFRILYDYAPEPYLIISQSGKITELNIATEKLFDKKSKQLKLKNIFDTNIINKKDIDKVKSILKQKKHSAIIPEISICANKIFKPVELRSFLVKFQEKYYYLVVLHDISIEKQAQEILKKSSSDLEKQVNERTIKLKKLTEDLQKEIEQKNAFEKQISENEARYRLLFNATNDAIFMVSLKDKKPTNFIQVNDNAIKRYGYTAEEFAKIKANQLYEEDEFKTTIPKAMKELFEKKEALFETVHKTKNGKTIPVEINAHLIDYQGKPTILSSVRDISDRYNAQKNIEEKLAEMERMNSLMIGRELRMADLKEKLQEYQELLKKNNIKI